MTTRTSLHGKTPNGSVPRFARADVEASWHPSNCLAPNAGQARSSGARTQSTPHAAQVCPPHAATQTACTSCLAPLQYWKPGRPTQAGKSQRRVAVATRAAFQEVSPGHVSGRIEAKSWRCRGQPSLSEPRAPHDECHSSRDDQNDDGNSSNYESIRGRPRIPRAEVCDIEMTS